VLCKRQKCLHFRILCPAQRALSAGKRARVAVQVVTRTPASRREWLCKSTRRTLQVAEKQSKSSRGLLQVCARSRASRREASCTSTSSAVQVCFKFIKCYNLAAFVQRLVFQCRVAQSARERRRFGNKASRFGCRIKQPRKSAVGAGSASKRGLPLSEFVVIFRAISAGGRKFV